MKWRNSVLYLLILVLVGGYFYYFEVVKKEQKELSDKESKKLYHFKTDQVLKLEIYPKDKSPVVMMKDAGWRIVDPIRTEADRGACENLITAISGLEAEREVVGSAEDLKPYGLQQPLLKVRFQVGEAWSELLIGEKNPLGGSYYAKTADKSAIVLIGAANWTALNKGLDELRRRELFTFQPSEVKAFAVTWRDGKSVRVERGQADNTWKALDNPELTIKSSKVENILGQIRWLRADGFLDGGVKDLETRGLKPPLVSVSVKLGDEKTVELLLSEKPEKEKQINAVSSELPFVVQVGTTLLEGLPKGLDALEDRSLFGGKAEDVKEVKWHRGDISGQALETEKNQWSVMKKGDSPKPLNEPWQVRTLLLDLKEAEFLSKLSPSPDKPAEAYAGLELRDSEKSLASFSWQKASEGNSEPVVVWVESSGKAEAVTVDRKTTSKLEEELNRFLQTGQQNQ
ncbi:MAG: DUF4340 domain-containing protein [Syntrophobacteraceae bacterium]